MLSSREYSFELTLLYVYVNVETKNIIHISVLLHKIYFCSRILLLLFFFLILLNSRSWILFYPYTNYFGLLSFMCKHMFYWQLLVVMLYVIVDIFHFSYVYYEYFTWMSRFLVCLNCNSLTQTMFLTCANRRLKIAT